MYMPTPSAVALLLYSLTTELSCTMIWELILLNIAPPLSAVFMINWTKESSKNLI